MLHRLQHDNIVQLVDCFYQDQELFLITELANSDLFDHIITSPNGKLDEDEARILMKQLLNALSFLHKSGVAHKDIKVKLIVGINLLLMCAHACSQRISYSSSHRKNQRGDNEPAQY